MDSPKQFRLLLTRLLVEEKERERAIPKNFNLDLDLDPTKNPTSSLPFPVPGGFANTPGYDSEGKALSIKRAFWGKATPHTIAFHLAWFSFMVAFWSSFAPAALITSIKRDLNLSKGQIADSNVAAVLGGVVARLFIGKFMDTFGPRYAFLLCLWGTAPVVFAISAVRNFTEYALCRFFIAWSLAAVIPCIQWTTNMYNGMREIVLEFF